MSLTKFSTGWLCGCEQSGALDWKNTQNVEIAEETEFLRISQKSHFPKIYYRFWKLFEASTWDQKCVVFGQHNVIPYRASSVHFATGNFHPFRILPLSAIVWNLNNTMSMRQKSFPKMFRSSPIYGTNTLGISLQSDQKGNLQSGAKVSVLKAP